MGMAILPGRLKAEIELIIDFILNKMNVDDIQTNDCLYIHQQWINALSEQREHMNKLALQQIIEVSIGHKFTQMLECAGVFKNTPQGNQAFIDFIQDVNRDVANL